VSHGADYIAGGLVSLSGGSRNRLGNARVREPPLNELFALGKKGVAKTRETSEDTPRMESQFESFGGAGGTAASRTWKKDVLMTQVMDPKPTTASTDTDDLAAAVQRVLAASPEPLTVPKIRASLPAALRQGNVEDVLRRQVAANVLYQYPKYRSQHDRYW